MALRVAVDFGTSTTCVAVSAAGGEPRVLVIDGHPFLPSAVYAGADGRLFVGQEADRQAAIDPARYEPTPKRRIDDGELLLGTQVLPVRDAVRAVFARACAEARRFAGGAAIDQLVVTHPADWGVVRARTLRQAATGLSRVTELVPEPVAAAVFYAAGSSSTGEALAVLDLGGGTVDVSVVRAEPGSPSGFAVLASQGDPTFGGVDIDQALLGYVADAVARTDDDRHAWRALLDGADLEGRRRRRMVLGDVRGAKETLSRHPYADVPLPSPFADAHVTRPDLERLLREPLGRVMALTAATIAEAGIAPGELGGFYLAGGSSRIPMVSRLVQERFGLVPICLDQPETVVARGALLATSAPAAVPVQPGRRAIPPPPPAPESQASQARAGGNGRRLRRTIGVVAVVLGTVAVAGAAMWWGSAGTREVTEFGLRFERPPDWAHVVGAETVTLRPDDRGDRQVITVRRTALGFDGGADRDRMLGAIRQEMTTPGRMFGTLEPDVTFAGRRLIHFDEYREDTAAVPELSTVDWFVLVDRTVRVTIGCEWTEPVVRRVKEACTRVVGTLRVTG